MAIKSDSVTLEIAGEQRTFQVNQLPATRAQEVIAKLGNLLGGGLAGREFGQVIGEILRTVTAKDLEWLQKTLLFDAGALIDNVPFSKALFDTTFAGELIASYKLLLFALDLNFKDFSKGLAVLGDVAKAKLSSSGILGTFFGPSIASSKTGPDTEPSTTGKPA